LHINTLVSEKVGRASLMAQPHEGELRAQFGIAAIKVAADEQSKHSRLADRKKEAGLSSGLDDSKLCVDYRYCGIS
jgi:hypothetical protein